MFPSFLSFLDLFTSPMYLYLGGKQKKTSDLGVLLSLIIFTFLGVSFIQSDLFEKKSPYVVNQSLQTPNSAPIAFDDDTLISFSLSDPDHNSYIDPTLFAVKFKYYHVRSNGFGATEVIFYEIKDLQPCTEDDMPFKNHTLFKVLGLKNSFCLKNKSFDIFGFWDESEVRYVSMNLYMCDNSTANGTCKSQEEIDYFLTNTQNKKFFNFICHNTQIDSYNYEDPFKVIYKSEYQMIDPTVTKRMNIFIKNAEISTDDGVIFPSISTEYAKMFASKDFDFQTRIDPKAPLYQFLLYSSKEKVQVSRNYKKLPEILGSLTGMINLFILVGFVLIRLVTHVNTLRLVLNKLYLFPVVKKKTKKSKNKTKKSLKVINQEKDKYIESTSIATIRNLSKKSPHVENTMKNLIEVIQSPTNLQCEQFPVENNPPKSKYESKTKSELYIEKKIIKEDSFVLEHYSEKNLDKNENNKEINEINVGENKLKKIISKKSSTPTKLEIQEIKKTQFKLSYFEYFCYGLKKISCWKRTRKQLLIEKAEEQFISELDVVNILTKVHEFEKLKMILLDADQLVLFNHVTKPMIYVNEDDLEDTNQLTSSAKMRMTQLFMKNSTLKENSLKETYKKILQCQETSIINQRLIEFIDQKKEIK